MKLIHFQLLSTLINSCCLALLDACVPMTTVFSAVTCAYNKDGELVTDLTPQEEQVSRSSFDCLLFKDPTILLSKGV